MSAPSDPPGSGRRGPPELSVPPPPAARGGVELSIPPPRGPEGAESEGRGAGTLTTLGPGERGPILRVEKLSKYFEFRPSILSRRQIVHAVEGVSFYVRFGETLGLVGESGSGKSTVGRAVLRLTEPSLGRIHFDGVDITRMREAKLRRLRRRAQIVFQDPYGALNPRMTVRDIVAEGIVSFGLEKAPARVDERVAEVLARVGMRRDAMGRYPHEFSGGQRQRIGIARALAVGPEFVVCDEPVSALDVSVQAQILNLLESLQEEAGTSYLFISHDLRVVQHVSHRIAVMYLGRIVEMGPATRVVRLRHHPYTRALWAASALGADAAKRRLVVAGEPPSAVDPPSGCVFRTRCPKAKPGTCDVEVPRLVEIEKSSHHRVACHFPELD